MQTIKLFFYCLLFLGVSLSIVAQSVNIFTYALPTTTRRERAATSPLLKVFAYPPPPVTAYQNCAAILYRGKVLVDNYSPDGSCKLETDMAGTLSVATVSLSDSIPPITGNNIGFRVAIKNDRTNTLWLYSTETLFEVQLEDILRRCEMGDRIVFLTVDQEYSLPHHEILLNWGAC